MKNIKSIFLAITILITITFYSCNKEEAVESTWLEVSVLDEGNKAVENAFVRLYANEYDLADSKNVIQKGNTDNMGKIIFKDLEPQKYYIDVEKDDLNNWFGVKSTNGEIEENKKTTVEITIR